MNLDQIETKCFILALFIRDDGERFLLGSRAYEFVDSQLHFVANSYQNDIVEVQGNDGVMLAGQVRRGTSQPFDGYIGDQTVERTTIEQYRRDFMKFFRKNHYYKVVYVFPDGSAVQRRNGFIVEAPEVKELYQLFPQYHISMNFEDINYYVYEEDAEGEEIYGESATLKIATSATGGLIWEEGTESEISGEGSQFTLQDTIDGNVLDSVQLKGDTEQQTYSGKNLLYVPNGTYSSGGINWTVTNDTITGSGTVSSSPSQIFATRDLDTPLGPGTYTFSISQPISYAIRILFREGTTNHNVGRIGSGQTSATFTTDWTTTSYNVHITGLSTGASFSLTMPNKLQLESGSSVTSFEPYVGGIASPNPEYPQTVNTVTGRQVVTISDSDSQSQEYEVNLGKNLFNGTYVAYAIGGNSGTQFFSAANSRTAVIECKPNTTYTISKNTPSNRFNICDYSSYPTGTTDLNGLANQGSQVLSSLTVTTHSDAKYMFICVSNDSTEPELQVELGSTATSYAPYFEPIELCKLSSASDAPAILTYQDYIYKSGNDWYIHKEIAKAVFDGTEDWRTHNTHNGIDSFSLYTDNAAHSNSAMLADSYRPVYITTYNSDTLRTYGQIATLESTTTSTNKTVFMTSPDSSVSALAQFKEWLASNPVTVYYASDTTDTQITNTALIAQLNALASATTYNGTTSFTVSSANQLAILDVTVIARTGGGVVWDNYGAEWEEGTGGGPTMVNVDSIDNVYPVLTLTGPAVNPQISVLTTNTTLSYSGTITSSQELKIDMFNKTATLNGASVVGNVSGDWVYLKPGVNRITYTTNNADAPDSTLWWQEIVG